MDEQADYQSDLLFHGLRSLLGEQCVDVPKKDYMYETYPQEMAGNLWGRGFTYSRTLPDIAVDRTLSPQEADLVVFSIHHSLQFQFDYQINEFLNLSVPVSKIAVVDGHDWPKYNAKLACMAPLYFKREIDSAVANHIKPVWFAMPQEKIVEHIPNKVRDFARIYPGSTEAHWPKNSRASHVFTNEADYYKEYQESRFAFTCKKGGWDCMRHLEILGNGCIPIFTDVENCPMLTCRGFSHIQLAGVKTHPLLQLPNKNDTKCYAGYEAKFGEEKWFGDKNDWYEMMSELWQNRQRWTTEHLAKYFIRSCQK